MSDVDLSGFEEFDRRAAPVSATPMVTLQRKGLFSLNRAAFEALGEAQTVTLLYNRERRIIGIRPTEPSSPRAYPVRRVGQGHTYIIAGTAFTSYYQIPTDTARRYVAAMLGDMLTIDLTQDAPVVTGVRARNSSGAQGKKPTAGS